MATRTRKRNSARASSALVDGAAIAVDEGVTEEKRPTRAVARRPTTAVTQATTRLVAPKGLKPDEASALKRRAKELAQQLEKASGSKELETIDSISNLGVQSQRSSASEINLLRGRVGDMLTREGPAAKISGDMVDLRMALRSINPHEVDDKGVLGWLLRGGPLGHTVDSIREILEKIAIRYEPVSKQVGVIEARLREGRTMLLKDNIELRKLYESVEAQQLPVKKNAYLGELLMRELDALSNRTQDELKRDRVRNVLHDVSLRVQDLRTMEEVDVQFFVSVDMTRQNNTRLAQAVERTLALSTNVVVIGLAIQMALARQKRVMEANQRTREFLGTLITTNAAAIKRHTTEIGDAYNNPVIAIDKITQAHNDLVEALDAADRIKEEGITKARENIAKLAQMSSDLERRQRAISEVQLKSVEA